MGRSYEQLSLEERCEIARLSSQGGSIRQIAAALDRSPSTISRELKRNRRRAGRLQAGYAQQQTRARRWTGSRLEREPSLRARCWSGLAQRLVARADRRPARPRARAQGDQPTRASTASSTPRSPAPTTIAGATTCRAPRASAAAAASKGGSPAKLHRRPCFRWQNGPLEAADRKQPGHWEADLMLFCQLRPGRPGRA